MSLPPISTLTMPLCLRIVLPPPYYPAAARFAIVLAKAAGLPYSPSEGRSVCALSFRWTISILSPRRSICLLSRRRSVSLLSPRRRLGFLIISAEAAPFAHCPSAARFPYCPPDFFSSLVTSNFASGHHTILSASKITQARRNARSD